MARIKYFDQKSIKNRARVKKHRYFQKIRTIHEENIYKKLHSNTSSHTDGVFNNSFEPSDKATEIKNKIIQWALHYRIARIAVNDLLSILLSAGLSFLPRDSRTLMATPANVKIDILSNGKMWYCGIKKCLEHALTGIQQSMSITLDFNFDGLPIAKSSNKQFWPILSSIRGIYFFLSKILKFEYIIVIIIQIKINFRMFHRVR